MSTQLRLVESPEPKPAPRSRRAGRARTAKSARARKAHWAVDWRLDPSTRRTGREGVAAAHEALARARGPEADLREAS